ncbi:MAG: glycosyltransferase family 2 protein [Leptolyngbyaceae cyanobacterium CSU_1_3]|nr:glycosyltransferase family 2 protein [Leptolyngbyaceae cyanobacterium CSU_1_3]
MLSSEPILVFLVPLRSAWSAKSWVTVCNLLERTLRSICNQTLPSFHVLIVCHDRPILSDQYNNTEYVEVDYPAPKQPISVSDGDLDKARKLWTGIQYAQKFANPYLMFMDADDCVSKNIVEFIAQQPQSNGWYISKGYQYREGSWLIQYRK